MTTPIHIAISLTREGVGPDHIERLIKEAVTAQLLIITFGLPTSHDADYLNTIAEIFDRLTPLVLALRCKVSVLGHWYALPSRVVTSIKSIMEATKDHDTAYATFCVNYDGHQEIVDAARLLAQHVRLGRLDPNAITAQGLKENMYTSGIVPPAVIIQMGEKLDGFLLWDSRYARVYRPDSSMVSLRSVIEWYTKKEN